MKSKYLIIQLGILAFLMVYALFLVQGRIGFNLWDEGYLWYGAQRVMAGEVPIRDFMSYEPGRYYWSAVFMSLWENNGILALRSSVAVFQALGLVVGLFLITWPQKKLDIPYIILSGIILVVWMYPRHKLFDISLSIFLIGVLALLIQKPTNRHYFLTGLTVGLIATFGRNHGVYGAAGSVIVLVWICVGQREYGELFKRIGIWSFGVVAGYLPIILMVIFVPDFAPSFFESILFQFEYTTTNLPLPIPWPWLVDFSSSTLSRTIREILIGLFYISIVVLPTSVLIWFIIKKYNKKPETSALIAASIIALPYAHHAYSRADISHLAQSILPFLIGCLIFFKLLSTRIRWFFILMLCFSSIFVMYIYHPGGRCLITNNCVNYEISGTTLLVHNRTAATIELLTKLVNQYASNGQNFIVTPLMVSAYPLFLRRSPMRDIFGTRIRSKEFQQKEITRIKAADPGFVLIYDFALDGKDELRYENTHSIIYQYILDNYDPITELLHYQGYQIYKRKKNIN